MAPAMAYPGVLMTAQRTAPHPHTGPCGFAEILGGAAQSGAGFSWRLLPRYGRRPVQFSGRGLLHASNQAVCERDHLPAWSALQVYERGDGGFVVAILHQSVHPRAPNGAITYSDAWPEAHAAAVPLALRRHDPSAVLNHAGQATRLSWIALLDAAFGPRG
jgi:hypothetical protein